MRGFISGLFLTADTEAKAALLCPSPGRGGVRACSRRAKKLERRKVGWELGVHTSGWSKIPAVFCVAPRVFFAVKSPIASLTANQL